MGQNASKTKSELKRTESLRTRPRNHSFNVLLELQRLQTEVRERTEMETEMNQADQNHSDDKMKRRDSEFLMLRNVREGNKALDFLGEYHLLNALNKEGISNINTNLFLGLNADSLPISNESPLKYQEEASSMYASAYDSNLIQSSAAHLMKKKMARAMITSKETALLVDGVLEEQSKNKFKKFANILQNPRGSDRTSQTTEENRRSRKSYFKEPCRKCGEDGGECSHHVQRDSIVSKPRNSEGFAKLGMRPSQGQGQGQGQINPKLLADLEKMRVSIQKVQSVNIIKEDKEEPEIEEEEDNMSSNEQSQNSQSIFNLANQNIQNTRFTFNRSDNLKSSRSNKEESEQPSQIGNVNDRKKKLMLKISTEPTSFDPRVCEKVAKREQVPVVYANLVNQRYTKRSQSPEKQNKSTLAIRPVSPPSQNSIQSGAQTPVLQNSFLNKTNDPAFSKAENVVFPNKYSGYQNNYKNNPNYPSLHLDTVGDYSPKAVGPATTRTPYQAQSSQLEAYYHKRYTPTQSTTSLTPKSQNEMYSRKVEFQPTTPTQKSRNEIHNQRHVQYVPYVNPAHLSQSYNYSPQPLRVEFDLSMMQPTQSQENFYSRKTEYIPYTGGIQPGVYKNLNTPMYRYTDNYTGGGGRDYRNQERSTYIRTQPPLQDHYNNVSYTSPVNRTSYEDMKRGTWNVEDSHRKWQPSPVGTNKQQFTFPVVQKAVGPGYGYGRNF